MLIDSVTSHLPNMSCDSPSLLQALLLLLLAAHIVIIYHFYGCQLINRPTVLFYLLTLNGGSLIEN